MNTAKYKNHIKTFIMVIAIFVALFITYLTPNYKIHFINEIGSNIKINIDSNEYEIGKKGTYTYRYIATKPKRSSRRTKNIRYKLIYKIDDRKTESVDMILDLTKGNKSLECSILQFCDITVILTSDIVERN